MNFFSNSHKLIYSISAKRGAQPGTLQGFDHEEKKRLKRRLSKAKLKEKRRQDKEKGNPVAGGEKQLAQSQKAPSQLNAAKKLTNGHAPNVKSDIRPSPVGPSNKKAKQADTSPSTVPPRKPAVIDKDGRMVFSKFDFALPGVVEESEKDKWAKKNSGKDYKRLLEKQERLDGKLKELEEKEDLQGAKKLKEKTQWDTAAQRAKGAKVKVNFFAYKWIS